MGLFSDMLKEGESLFRDTVVLDFDFQPKLLKFRENEQMRFAKVEALDPAVSQN